MAPIIEFQFISSMTAPFLIYGWFGQTIIRFLFWAYLDILLQASALGRFAHLYPWQAYSMQGLPGQNRLSPGHKALSTKHIFLEC
jgi:hypothetical protein